MTTFTPLNDLKKRLCALKPWQRTAFATAIAQRSLPNYALFAEMTGFGDTSELSHCLNMLWDCAAGQQSPKNFERLLERLEEQTPDVAQFDMYGVYPALNVITALTTAIYSTMDPAEDDAWSNAQLSLSTISQFLAEIEAPELEGKELSLFIKQHPLNLQQLDFMEEALALLELAKPNKEMKTALRQLAMNDNVSELGIGMEH